MDTRFYKGGRGLVINRSLNRVEKDTSGLTFELGVKPHTESWHLTTTCVCTHELEQSDSTREGRDYEGLRPGYET